MTGPLRIGLGGRPDHAVRFEAESFVVEGVPRIARRRVALGDVYGIERVGAWLWVGAGVVPVLVGGDDAPVERLARVEAELRARIAALPAGAQRLARLDRRRAVPLGRPWLSFAAAAGLGAALLHAGALEPRASAAVLLFLAVGLVAEPAFGAWRLLAAGAAALAAASAVAGAPLPLGVAPLAFALGGAALAVVGRLRREAVLSVRMRSTLDLGLVLALAVAAHALSLRVASGALAAGAAAGALVALALLRRWPAGAEPRPG